MAETCERKIMQEGRILKMVVFCRKCKGGAATISDPKCMSRILSTLSEEMSVDTIVLSHHLEIQYGEEATELLKRIVRLLSDIHNLGARHPIGNLKQCQKCPFMPKSFFDSIGKKLMEGPTALFDDIQKICSDIYNMYSSSGLSETCQKCLNTTIGDLNYVYKNLDRLIKQIVKDGFQIII